MTKRLYTSKTILGVGSAPGLEPYDLYYRSVDGTNTDNRLRKLGIYTENTYDGYTSFERADAVKAALRKGDPPMFSMNAFTIGGKPIPAEPDMPYPYYSDMMSKLEERWKQSEFNVGVFAAEGKDSLRMMATRLESLRDAAVALKQKHLLAALKHMTGSVPPPHRARARNRMDVGDLSGAWLELHLGWSPMMSDIYNAANIVMFMPWQNRVTVRASNKCSMQAAAEPEKWHVEGQCKRGVQIIVTCRSSPSWLDYWGLTNPAGIAWEATRMSFVVDWFLPIGRYLDNMHAVASVPVYSVTTTEYEKIYGKSLLVVTPVAGVWPNGNDFHGLFKSWKVRRRTHASLLDIVGTTGFLPKTIKPKWAPDVWKVTTAAALLDQALRGLKGSR